MTMLDPRFLLDHPEAMDEEWLFNIPEFRGTGQVELHTFGKDHEIVPAGTMTASAFMEALDKACKKYGERVCLYFYSDPLDGSVLYSFPNVANLHIASWEFTNPGSVAKLEKLSTLTFDAAFCDNPDILELFAVPRLRELTIVETPDRKLDLAPLTQAKNLKRLRLMGQYRNVEAIAALDQLRELVLYPSRRLDLAFLEQIGGLRVLKFAIGALETLESLGTLPNLRDLSFELVRFLEELGDLQRFPTLERLRLNDQKRLTRIVTGAGNTNLKHINLGGAPELTSIEGLAELPSLISLSAHSTGLELGSLGCPKSLTHLQIITKQMKPRRAIEKKIEALGYITTEHPDSDFFYK